MNQLSDQSLDDGLQAIYKSSFTPNQLSRMHFIIDQEGNYYIVLDQHHIVTDGWSQGIILKELGSYYKQLKSGQLLAPSDLDYDYRDYAFWQNQRFSTQLDDQLNFWTQRLQGVNPILDFPRDHPYPATPSLQNEIMLFEFSDHEQKLLEQLSRTCGLTNFQTCFALFSLLTHRFTQQNDFLLGTAMANRSENAFESIAGFFVNTIAVRLQLSPEMTFQDLASNISTYFLDMLEFGECPFEELVKAINPPRHEGRSPLIQLMVTEAFDALNTLEMDGLEVEPLRSTQQNSEFDLTVFFACTKQLSLRISYNKALFEASSITRIKNSFQQLLHEVSSDAKRPLVDYDLLNKNEKGLLESWNQTQVNFQAQTIHSFIEKQSLEKGTQTALKCDGQKLSFQELNEASTQLAAVIQEQQLTTESPIGVYCTRNFDMIISMLAIMKAGGAYVPLDPEYPRERLDHIIQQSGLELIIYEKGLDLSPLDSSKHKVDCKERSLEPLTTSVTAQNLAYILYTSGSTGIPKGVAIEHRSVCALFEWVKKDFDPNEFKNVLASASICFDFSVLEIWMTLAYGGCVTLCENILSIEHIPEKNDLSMIQTVPSAARLLLEEQLIPDSVDTLILGGEYLDQNLVDQLYEKTQVQKIVDIYGPTEETVCATSKLRMPGAKASIGTTIPNTRAYVLDSNLNLLPPGLPGELFLAGEGLARGYYKDPQRTADSFVSSSFLNETRIYKTGDQVRWNTAGELEYLGRLDNQVKIRGFRIELDEIISQIKKFPAVKDAMVLCQNNQLIAYVCWHEEDLDSLNQSLKDKLPHYMLPNHIVSLEKLPLNANSKMDRNLLPSIKVQTKLNDKPQTDLEITIAKLWQTLLEVDNIGRHDDFFQRGGYSILALKFTRQLKALTQHDISLNNLFKYPILSNLAQALESRDKIDSTWIHITKSPCPTKTPLTWVGHRPSLEVTNSIINRNHDIHFVNVRWNNVLPEHTDFTVTDFAHESIHDLDNSLDNSGTIICGFSFGALMAYEQAHKLISNGINVPLVVLLDPSPIHGEILPKNTYINKESRLRWLIRNGFEVLTGNKAKWRLLKHRFVKTEINDDAIGDSATKNISSIYSKAARNYKPLPLDTHVIIFCTHNTLESRKTAWRSFLSNVEFISLPIDNHLEVIKDPASCNIWYEAIEKHMHKYENE